MFILMPQVGWVFLFPFSFSATTPHLPLKGNHCAWGMTVIFLSLQWQWFECQPCKHDSVQDFLFTFPGCKRSCTVPSVCHPDANKPHQVSTAMRLVRNGLMLGLILPNFSSLSCNKMVKWLKDSELLSLRKRHEREGTTAAPSEIGPECFSIYT